MVPRLLYSAINVPVVENTMTYRPRFALVAGSNKRKSAFTIVTVKKSLPDAGRVLHAGTLANYV